MTEPRFRLDQPRLDRRGPRFRIDQEAFGRLTERVARFLGTGRYLLVQTGVIILWMVENVIPDLPHFDPYPFQFLTLVLSLQAAYAAPLILLAQNRQDDRDRVNLEADREEARESKADLEYLTREIASIRMALGEVATRDFLRSEVSRLVESRDGRDDKQAKEPKAPKPPKDARPKGLDEPSIGVD
jgi:uncharacterized membrane protein